MRLSGVFSVVLGAAALGARTALAQGASDVVCLPSFGWANNSLEQNPCVVGAYLQAQCNSGTFTINSIPDGYHYIGPTNETSTQNACICSTPVYQLVSACGACQNRTWISWDTWSFYCPADITSQQGVFPETIPSGTLIPKWAYIPPNQFNDFFNVTAAENVGDTPESSQIISSTTSSSASTSTFTTTTTTTGGAVVTVTATSTGPASSTPSGSGGGGGGGGTNTGAIAGGVVGGVVGLGLIALLAFYLTRRRNAAGAGGYSKEGAAGTGAGAGTGPGAGAGGTGGPEMAAYGAGAGAAGAGAYQSVPPQSPTDGQGTGYAQSQYTHPSGSAAYSGYPQPQDPVGYSSGTPAPSGYSSPSYGHSSFPSTTAPMVGGQQQGYYNEPQHGAGRYSGMPEV